MIEQMIDYVSLRPHFARSSVARIGARRYHCAPAPLCSFSLRSEERSSAYIRIEHYVDLLMAESCCLTLFDNNEGFLIGSRHLDTSSPFGTSYLIPLAKTSSTLVARSLCSAADYVLRTPWEAFF